MGGESSSSSGVSLSESVPQSNLDVSKSDMAELPGSLESIRSPEEDKKRFFKELDQGLQIMSHFARSTGPDALQAWLDQAVSPRNQTMHTIILGADDLVKISNLLLDRSKELRGEKITPLVGETDVRSTQEKLDELLNKYKNEKENKSQSVDSEKLMSDDVLISVIHDIRNPLGAVKGYAQYVTKLVELGRPTDRVEEGLRNALNSLSTRTSEVYEMLGTYPVEELSTTFLVTKLRNVVTQMAREQGLTASVRQVDTFDPPAPFVASDHWITGIMGNIAENTKDIAYKRRDISREDETLVLLTGEEVATYGRMVVEVKRSEEEDAIVVEVSDFGGGYIGERLEGFTVGGTDRPLAGGRGIGMGSKAELAKMHFPTPSYETRVTPMNVLRDKSGKITHRIYMKEIDERVKLIQEDLATKTAIEITNEQADVSAEPYAGALTQIVFPIQTFDQFQERKTIFSP